MPTSSSSRVGHSHACYDSRVTPAIRFLQSRVGARIAYKAFGTGPPLVMLPAWTSHLEAERSLGGYQAFHTTLAQRHTVVLFDRWGCGLSDRDRTDLSFDADVTVLTDLVDHLKLRRFTLLAVSHGGPVAARFANENPGRVSHLVLYGQKLSDLSQAETWSAMRDLIVANPQLAIRSIAAAATRGGDGGDLDAFAEILRASATPEMMIALQDAALKEDVDETFAAVRVPTLVLGRQDDAILAPEEPRRLATLIPGARLELLEGTAHVHYTGDSADIARHVVRFTAGTNRTPSAHLSPRETEVIDLLSQGLSNADIAQRLVLSIRTVERHLLNIYTKIGARSRTDAIAQWLAQQGALEPHT